LRVKGCGFAETEAPRRGVFRAALQQAEQLFGAAEAVDYSARPLLAFYGLSQACLAVIQASPRSLKQNASPNGHGMKFDASDTGIGTLTDAGDARGTLALR
jgi:YaaC-like Protein